ncbi:MAG: hypothetical protein ABSG86_04240 [Thermoguttaceae bacterium]|jgi:hypothetical protein
MAKQTETPKPPKVKRINRSAAANQVVAAIKGKTTLSRLAEQADALFVASGGKPKLRAAAWYVRQALETAEALGAVRLVRPTDLFVERVEG